MAKLFLPSVRCPNCSYANDSTFYFCQMCGYKRKRTPTNNNSYTDVNLETLDNRRKQLALFDQATRYAKQKDSLRRELERFFASLPSSPTVMTATPRDICRFLVYKDKSGKTQVHKNGCIY